MATRARRKAEPAPETEPAPADELNFTTVEPGEIPRINRGGKTNPFTSVVRYSAEHGVMNGENEDNWEGQWLAVDIGGLYEPKDAVKLAHAGAKALPGVGVDTRVDGNTVYVRARPKRTLVRKPKTADDER